MKKYGYNLDTTHQAIIFEIGTEAADSTTQHVGDTPGLIVGSSEWGRIEEDDARRICAALMFFSETSTEEIERLADKRFHSQTNVNVHTPLPASASDETEVKP
jgi:hypothetical protein